MTWRVLLRSKGLLVLKDHWSFDHVFPASCGKAGLPGPRKSLDEGLRSNGQQAQRAVVPSGCSTNSILGKQCANSEYATQQSIPSKPGAFTKSS